MKTITLNKNDIHKGSIILINKCYPLVKQGQEISLISVCSDNPDIRLEITTAAILTHMIGMLNCKEDIIPISGYRSMEEQQRIYTKSLEENGKAFTEKYVALPNHSEHQTGLAIDLALMQSNIDNICPEFPYEGICNVFREKAQYYGLIERYQMGKEKVTGIAHEPWHFRYIGYPHSLIMKEKNFVLEEYIEFIRFFPYKDNHFIVNVNKQIVEIFYVNASSHTEIQLPEDSIHQISGNNVDGFIVTIWR